MSFKHNPSGETVHLNIDDARIPMSKDLLTNYSETLAAIQIHNSAPKVSTYFPKKFLKQHGGPKTPTPAELKGMVARAVSNKTVAVNKDRITVDAELVGKSKRRKINRPSVAVTNPRMGSIGDVDGGACMALALSACARLAAGLFLFDLWLLRHINTYKDTNTYTYAHIHRHIHKYMYTYTYTYPYTYIHKHTCSHIHICTYTHTHVQLHTYTYTHTHTHTLLPSLIPW